MVLGHIDKSLPLFGVICNNNPFFLVNSALDSTTKVPVLSMVSVIEFISVKIGKLSQGWIALVEYKLTAYFTLDACDSKKVEKYLGLSKIEVLDSNIVITWSVVTLALFSVFLGDRGLKLFSWRSPF